MPLNHKSSPIFYCNKNRCTYYSAWKIITHEYIRTNYYRSVCSDQLYAIPGSVPVAPETLACLTSSSWILLLLNVRQDVSGTLTSPTIRHRRYSLTLKKTTNIDVAKVKMFILPKCSRNNFLISFSKISLCRFCTKTVYAVRKYLIISRRFL